MTTQQFTVPGRLPSLNEVIDVNRADPRAGNRLKRHTQDDIGWAIRAARLVTMTGPVDVSITWHEATRRRDPDNIMSGIKYVLDALVECGTLEGDSQRHIRTITHRVAIDRANPRVVVTLTSKEDSSRDGTVIVGAWQRSGRTRSTTASRGRYAAPGSWRAGTGCASGARLPR